MHGRDKKQLKRLCRYLMRPPLAEEHLQELPDGGLQLLLKKPWRDGTTSVVFEPLDFVARLVAAIPPPRAHMFRFHGVLAPHAKLRSLVVPAPPDAPTLGKTGSDGGGIASTRKWLFSRKRSE